MVSSQLYTNWSGCVPGIPALEEWRQLEDLKFKVIPGDRGGELSVLAHSGIDTVSQGHKKCI